MKESEKPAKEPEAEPMSQEVFSIFILKSQPSAMVQAENYLRNRKWIVGSSCKLTEALAYVIQKKPQYILLSADHPHKKLKILPKLLSQAFPCRVISFAEKSGSMSISIMNELSPEYNLYPPVSGPSVQRLILKILKDDELRAKGLASDGTPLKDKKEAEGSGLITFKGDATNSGEFSFESARSALSQLLESEKGSEASGEIGALEMSQPNSSSAPSISQEQKTGDSLSGNFGQAPLSPEMSATGSQAASAEAAAAQQSSARTEAKSATSGTNPKSMGAYQGGSAAPSAQEKSAQSSARNSASEGANSSESTPPTPSSQAGGLGATNGAAQKSAKTSGGKTQAWPKKKYRIENDPRYHKNNGTESIFVRGTQQAMEEVVNLKGSPGAPISNATNISCILVQGFRFSGYLVCAMGENRKVDKKFLLAVQQKLVQFLRSNGEDLKDGDVLDMKLQEVDFQDWTLEQAEFLRKSVHNGNEVAVAFFPKEGLEVALEESISKKMLQIKLEDLRENTPLEFDLYIYMPENNKYLLYTPQGKALEGQQKSRLKERGVTHMHLKKEALVGVKKYHAQNFLNDKINIYKATKNFTDQNPLQ